MNVKKLKKILENFDDAADIFIHLFANSDERFDIEIITKDENVFYDGYGKYSKMNIMVSPRRKRG